MNSNSKARLRLRHPRATRARTGHAPSLREVA
jgi:hypothetical protein